MKIRINNIECRNQTSNSGNYEIIKWYENEYYGTEQEMLDEGYIYKDRYYTKGNVSVHEDCFKSPESCFVIADLEINHREPDINLRTVGSRLLRLNNEERNDFFDVYRIANDKIFKQFDYDED